MTSQMNIGLLRAARAEFAAKLLPGLAAEHRYTGAMLKRALDVLLAGAEAEDPALALTGFADATEAARAIRARQRADAPALRAELRDYVARKLSITNPRFLADSQWPGNDRERGQQ